MKNSSLSRRKFVEKSAVGLGAGFLGLSSTNRLVAPRPKNQRLPREVWIGSVSTMGLRAATPSEMVQNVLQIMDSLVPYQPDIICLPEGFAYAHVQAPFEVKDVAEQVPGPVVTPVAQFAKVHNCYVICPIYSRYKGDMYISAVLIDRKGEVVGEYHKARPTEGEMQTGVRPGPLKPPVFETDFGKIGIQICFDIKWESGWQHLKDEGAEIIFWPSAYAGGREVNSRAWRHQVYMVSSTQKDTSKICDLSGEVIARTGRWQPNWICAPVNLEKAFLHAWPAVRVFGDIQRKYGRKIRLTTFDEEEWTLIESLDPDIKMADVLKEFDLQTHDELMAYSEEVQEARR